MISQYSTASGSSFLEKLLYNVCFDYLIIRKIVRGESPFLAFLNVCQDVSCSLHQHNTHFHLDRGMVRKSHSLLKQVHSPSVVVDTWKHVN